MKKLILLLAVLLCLINIKVFNFSKTNNNIFKSDAILEITTNKIIINLNAKYIKSGNDYVYITTFKNLKNALKSVDNLKCITIKDSIKNVNINKFIKKYNYKLVENNKFSMGSEMLLHTNLIKVYNVSNCKKFNTQVAFVNGCVVVGIPYIKQGF